MRTITSRGPVTFGLRDVVHGRALVVGVKPDRLHGRSPPSGVGVKRDPGRPQLAEELTGLAAHVDVEVAAGADDGVAPPPGPGDRGPADRPPVGAGDQRRPRPGVQPGQPAPLQVLQDRRPGREGQEGDALGRAAASLLVADGQRLGLGLGEQPPVGVQRAEVADPHAQQLGQVQAAADAAPAAAAVPPGRPARPRAGAGRAWRRAAGRQATGTPFSRNQTLAPMARPATAASGWPSRARARASRERSATGRVGPRRRQQRLQVVVAA